MTTVKVKTKMNKPVCVGVIVSEWSEDGHKQVQVQTKDGLTEVFSDRYYVVEVDKEAQPADQAQVEPPQAEPSQMIDPNQGMMQPMVKVKPKSRETLSDEDVERVISKVSDVALAALKSIGLKSGEIYPLMINITTALKSAMTPKKG